MTQSALKTFCSLLLLSSITQGFQDVPVYHYKTKDVLVGQNTSLPCFIENLGTNIFITSTEWSKKDTQLTKLALYTPGRGLHYFVSNVTLKTIDNGTDKLMGTRLELANINNGHAGSYVCDIASFPNGSLQKKTELRVKDKIECDRNSTIEVNSGENVTIHCDVFSDVTYTWSKDELVVSDRPSLHLWSVSGASAGLYTLTANTGNSRLQATFTITVFKQTPDYRTDSTSQSPHYHSNSSRSAAPSSSPVSASTQENTHNSTATISQSMNQSLFTTSLKDTQSETYTILNYNQSESFVRTVSPPSETVSTDMRNNQSQATTVSPVHDTSVSNKTQLLTEGPSDAFTTSLLNTSLPMTVVTTGASLNSTPGSSTDATMPQDPGNTDGQSQLVLTLSIIGVLLLLIVALVLYRRRVIKKRLDLPPPFKPPPPPVKYAAVRNPQQQFPMDRCNSVPVGSRVEMRHMT